MVKEAISSYTTEVNGKKVPMWNSEEVDEIVTAQVCGFITYFNLF